MPSSRVRPHSFFFFFFKLLPWISFYYTDKQITALIQTLFFSSAESLFNRRVEEKAKEMLFTPLGWHHSSLDQLREENGEKKAMERLLCVKNDNPPVLHDDNNMCFLMSLA